MSKHVDVHRPEKSPEKKQKIITKIEYQRKPKWKENSIESEADNSVRHPAKLSNTVRCPHMLIFLLRTNLVLVAHVGCSSCRLATWCVILMTCDKSLNNW